MSITGEPQVPASQLFPEDNRAAGRKNFGLLRAQVKNRDDRDLKNKYLGRIQVWIPQVHGEEYEDRKEDLPWAWPCKFAAGKDEDVKFGSYYVPSDDSWVYVLLENGDPDRPVWFGAWYGEQEEESELPDEFIDDERSSARYPDLIGWISPWEGKFKVRVLKAERFELLWGDVDDPDAIVEFDSVGYSPNSEPTLRVHTKWVAKVSAEKDVELESTTRDVKVKCRHFLVEATGNVAVDAEGNSEYKAAGTNTFKGATIKGSGTPNGGFDLYGLSKRTPDL